MQRTNPHISPTWPGKLERKIDVYIIENGKWRYLHSTNAYKTLRDARKGASIEVGKEDNTLKALFA